MNNFIKTFVLLLLIPLLLTCKKEKKIVLEFAWVSNGGTFHYDNYSVAGIQKDARSLMIFGDDQGHYNLREVLVPDSTYHQEFFETNITGRYIIKGDGLYVSRPVSCGEGFFNFQFFTLYAPNNGTVDQQIPFYECKNTLAYSIKVTAADQTVTVPYGTFKTYVLQFKNGDTGYFDPNNGLIMYLTQDNQTNLTDTLKLSYFSK